MNTLTIMPDYFRLAAQQLGILQTPEPSESTDPEVAAHNTRAMRHHVFHQQCLAMIDTEGGVEALSTFVEALKTVEATRRELLDRR